MSAFAYPVITQSGERDAYLADAWQYGLAAAAELGLSVHMRPVPIDDPGARRCTLYRDGVPVGLGFGRGPADIAEVGALFEALERHLSRRPPRDDEIVTRPARDVVVQDAGWTTALTLLRDGEIGCARYVSLVNGATRDVPLFLSIPDYRGDYDYSAVGRYSSNGGWAAGTSVTEAVVHAINQTIERDAMSLLLIEQFLTPSNPLRVVNTRTLPADLAELHLDAETRLGQPVWLLDMTTDIGVPAYWAYTPAPAGRPARIRGCGASLSAHHAVTQALTELVQLHSMECHEPDLIPGRTVWTEHYPPLQRCYLADFAARMPGARRVTFVSPPAPATPREHLDMQLHLLRQHGFDVFVWERYVSTHLAVLNVFIPGAENFVAVADGHVVVPGKRGRGHMAISR